MKHIKGQEKIIEQLREKNENTIRDYIIGELIIRELKETGILENINSRTLEDLMSFADRDPAANSSSEYILSSYKSFEAVRLHRIAHELSNFSSMVVEKGLELKIIARRISEDAKVLTLVEIHPEARIGRRFVIDHGTHTVIGQTSEIGDDCYILQGVVLGARGIARNNATKRHPTLGNRVELGGWVQVLGAVTIGDDVKVSPWAVITDDVPARSKIIVRKTHHYLHINNNGKTSFRAS